MDNNDVIRRSVIQDMSEGLMTIGLNGIITYVNPAASEILGRPSEELSGKKFASCFFEFEENDAFNQMVLDAVYDVVNPHEGFVPYFTGNVTKQLHIRTSFLKENGNKIGIIAVLSDITELSELRDAVKAMEKIKELNGRLEMRNQLLSETFGRFLSDQIVKKLLDTPDGLALGGKKERLSIMMSDLRGFTALSMVMPANDLLTMLNHYLGEMTEIIQSNNGTIIEFIGDGIMAIFGAPVSSDKHETEAVAAAIQMQAKMKEINAWNKENGFPPLEMGIGINTGDVIVGNIGSEKRTKYGVTGNEVNICGRIESYTVGGQVLVAESTLKNINVPVLTESELDVKPKGVGKPIKVYHVTGMGEPYNTSCKEEYIKAVSLDNPVPVEYCRISEKHVGNDLLKGTFTALSYDEAVLVTDTVLNDKENLQFEFGGKLFAKVMSVSDNQYVIRFTSRPEGFTGN